MINKTRDIVIIAFFTAILMILKIVIDFIPNVELVTFMLILLSITYGKKTLYIANIFSLVCGVYYGFRDWTIMYIILFSALVLVSYNFRKIFSKNFFITSIFSAVFGLTFGWFFAIEWGLLYGINAGITYWINGIVFDIFHMVGNYFVMLLLGEKIYKVLKINFKKYLGGIKNV